MSETNENRDIVKVNSGDPIPVPTTSSKAIAAGCVGTAVSFLSALSVAIEDGVSSGEWINVALATVIGGAAAFGITWSVPTKIK